MDSEDCVDFDLLHSQSQGPSADPSEIRRSPAIGEGRQGCSLLWQPRPYNGWVPGTRRGVSGVSMSMIEAVDLTKTYRVVQKQGGVLGAMRGLYRREYREVRAVDRISFTIEPGEMVAFLGPNGAGK